MIFVPLSRALVILSSPPISSTRSRMPAKPNPSCRSLTLNPSPSSRSSRRSCFVLKVNRVSKLWGRAYFSALVKASCPICRRFSCQTGGSSRNLPRSSNRVWSIVPAVVFLTIPFSASQKLSRCKACGRSAWTDRRASFKLCRANSLALRKCWFASLLRQHPIASSTASNCTITPVNPCASVS